MKLKIYKLNIVNNDNYYIFAYSKEHAIVLYVEMMGDLGEKVNAFDINLSEVTRVLVRDAYDIIYDYNIKTDEEGQYSLGEFYDDMFLTGTDVYGVICDDFTC